jgi:hypothetical protein
MRAEAVIPGGMYGHQSVGLLPDDYPQFFEKAAKGPTSGTPTGGATWTSCAPTGRTCSATPIRRSTRPMSPARRRRHHDRPDRADRRAGRGDGRHGRHADWAMFCKNGTDATSMAVTDRPRPHQGRRPSSGPRAPIMAPRPGARRGRRDHRQRPGEPDLLRLQRRRQPGGRRGRRPATTWRRSSPRPSSTTPSSTRPSPRLAYARRRASSATSRRPADRRRRARRPAAGARLLLVADRGQAGPLHLGQVHRQRPSDLGAAGRDKARKAAAPSMSPAPSGTRPRRWPRRWRP